VTNYNFGSWESWVLEEGALWNVAFPDKQLRLEVMGVACATHQALWEQEAARSQHTLALHSALQTAQVCVCAGLVRPSLPAGKAVSVLVSHAGVTSLAASSRRSFGGCAHSHASSTACIHGPAIITTTKPSASRSLS
jgi:hypothetical protein